MAATASQWLRELLDSKTASNNEPGENQQEDVSAIVAAAPTLTVLEVADPLMKRLLEFARESVLHPIPSRYDTHKCDAARPASKDEWTDKQPGPMKTIRLTHLPQKELLELARKTFRDVHGNISQQTIGSLLVLAYNIMNDKGEYLTAEPCEDLIDKGSRISIEELSDKTAKKGSGKTITEIHRNLDEQKDKRLCIAYTYLAASYMRLFAKPAENYLKIKNHLKTRFQNFYPFSFPLENFDPDLDTIQFIRRQFELQDRHRNTFYVFLYASCENTAGKNLKEFLYITHVSFTELHPFVLFARVMDALDKTNVTLANGLFTNKFAVELDAIMDVFTKFVLANAGHDLQMWRFARVFDSQFLSVLQTKNCVLFTLVLAYILMVKDPSRNKGVLEIAQIKGANRSHKRVALAYALRAITIFESTQS